jgi:hypothetical protein
MNGKLREAKTLSEKLGAVILMKIHKNDAMNRKAREEGRFEEHLLGADDFAKLVTPFMELAMIQVQLAFTNPRRPEDLKVLIENEVRYFDEIGTIISLLES